MLALAAVIGVTALAPSLLFGSAAFLAGLAGAGLPILIHLINRRRAKVRPFAALAFLVQSNKRVAQRLKVRQLLLLIVRTILIACVPLALSKPALESDAGELATGQGPSANVIVLDNTFSMGVVAGRRTYFERAQRRASAFLSDLPREATAALLLVAPLPEPGGAPQANKGDDSERAELTFDHAEVERGIRSVKATDRAGDVEAAVRRADQLVALSPLPRKRIVVLTDLARHGFAGRTARSAPLRLQSGAQLVVHDVGRGEVIANRAVVALDVVPAADLGSGGHRVTARIANFGGEAVRGLPVLLRVDGRTVARGTVDLAPGETRAKVFHHRFAEGASVQGDVSIDADALPGDDVRRFALDVRRPAEALIVDGDPRQIPHLDEVFYLERALRLSGSPVRVRVTTPDERPAPDLRGFDVVFLANVRDISAQRAETLRAFVQGGGGLFISMGQEVDVDHYNRVLGGVLPRRLRAVRDVTYGGGAPVRFARPDLTHPVLSVFTGGALDGLLSGEARRYVHVEPGDETGVLLRFDDGAPALLHAARGLGHVLLLTTSIDRDWTDLPIRTAFLPLVQQAARFLARSLEGPGSHDVTVNEARTLPLGAGADEVLVEGPENLRVRLSGNDVRGRAELTFKDTDRVGYYRVSAVRAGKSESLAAFAVNPPATESDLNKLDAATAATLRPKGVVDTAPGAPPPLDQTALWPYLALALLAFLSLESFLVRRT